MAMTESSCMTTDLAWMFNKTIRNTGMRVTHGRQKQAALTCDSHTDHQARWHDVMMRRANRVVVVIVYYLLCGHAVDRPIRNSCQGNSHNTER
eukprot:scaffold60243_cov34-Prasinocladus_malaysianus.AAC.1